MWIFYSSLVTSKLSIVFIFLPLVLKKIAISSIVQLENWTRVNTYYGLAKIDYDVNEKKKQTVRSDHSLYSENGWSHSMSTSFISLFQYLLFHIYRLEVATRLNYKSGFCWHIKDNVLNYLCRAHLWTWTIVWTLDISVFGGWSFIFIYTCCQEIVRD